MVVELFGLPGAGKSYCCDELEKKSNFYSIMNFYKENFLGKIIFHLIIKFCLFNKEFKKIYNELLEIIKNDVEYKNFISKKNDIELYIKYMVFVFFIERRKMSKNIIIDEGIVHYCMVLYAEYSLEIEKCIKILEYFDKKVYLTKRMIYGIEIDKETVITRLKIRNRQRAPIDFVKGKELDSILSKYDEFIDLCSARYKILKLDLLISKISEEKDD